MLTYDIVCWPTISQGSVKLRGGVHGTWFETKKWNKTAYNPQITVCLQEIYTRHMYTCSDSNRVPLTQHQQLYHWPKEPDMLQCLYARNWAEIQLILQCMQCYASWGKKARSEQWTIARSERVCYQQGNVISYVISYTISYTMSYAISYTTSALASAGGTDRNF